MKRLCRSCLCTAALPLLSGCLLINAFLGVAGLVGPAPIQYASSAYTVGEYAYHYAARGKTPDEVIEEKLAALPPADEPEVEATLMADAAPESFAEPIPEPVQEAAPAPIVLAATSMPVPSAVTAAPAALRPAVPVVSRPSRRAVAEPAAIPAVWTPEALPYAAPDPLLMRMDRMESALAQAERMVLSRTGARTGDGPRMEATTQDAGQPGPGVSGGWSIRHPVMQYGPSAG